MCAARKCDLNLDRFHEIVPNRCCGHVSDRDRRSNWRPQKNLKPYILGHTASSELSTLPVTAYGLQIFTKWPSLLRGRLRNERGRKNHYTELNCEYFLGHLRTLQLSNIAKNCFRKTAQGYSNWVNDDDINIKFLDIRILALMIAMNKMHQLIGSSVFVAWSIFWRMLDAAFFSACPR